MSFKVERIQYPKTSDLDAFPRSSPHHDTALPVETLRSLGFREHHVAKLDLEEETINEPQLTRLNKYLSGSKLLLVPFKPCLEQSLQHKIKVKLIFHLVVLYEEVASLAMREEGSAQLAVVTVARNWASLN